MKYTLIFGLLAIASIGFASCSNETTATDMAQLPEPIQNTVNNNFSSNVISVTTETNTFGNDEYEIFLADGTKIKFEGEAWDEIEVPLGMSVPREFVLEPIQVYVNQNMPEQTIVKIDRDSKGYEVDLSNGVELKFDTNGTFIKVD